MTESQLLDRVKAVPADVLVEFLGAWEWLRQCTEVDGKSGHIEITLDKAPSKPAMVHSLRRRGFRASGKTA